MNLSNAWSTCSTACKCTNLHFSKLFPHQWPCDRDFLLLQSLFLILYYCMNLNCNTTHPCLHCSGLQLRNASCPMWDGSISETDCFWTQQALLSIHGLYCILLASLSLQAVPSHISHYLQWLHAYFLGLHSWLIWILVTAWLLFLDIYNCPCTHPIVVGFRQADSWVLISCLLLRASPAYISMSTWWDWEAGFLETRSEFLYQLKRSFSCILSLINPLNFA